MAIHLARCAALTVVLAFAASTADAAPRRAKVVKEVEEEDEEDEAPADDEEAVAAAEDDDDEEEVEEVEAPVKVRKRAIRKSERKPWQLAIGPNVWVASVDANVAVGEKSIGAAIDFFQLSRNTRYGVPLLAEARYKQFSFVGDFLYGVVDVASQKEIGPLMLTLDGTVKSLQFDGLAGYTVLGTDHSVAALEARGGIRYQRTAISGSLGVDGGGFSPEPIVDAGTDLLAAARATVRPIPWFFIAGTVDQSIAGSSTSTWSAGIEASVHLGSHVLLTAGYKTLTQQKSTISTVMHGPRAALQLVF